MSSQNIYLIGPMGAGKTTIGRHLARELGLEFYDSDHVIEERTGADINWIFDIEGEEGFRKREQQVIEDLTQLNGIVLATGGGVVITPENRSALAARGIVVYLEVSLEQQYRRTQNDKKRPLLQTENLRERLEHLAEERIPLYEDLADYTVKTEGLGMRAIIQQILKYLTEDK